MNFTIKSMTSTALAVCLSLTACTMANSEETYQGWTAEERNAMYYGTQGSRMIPRTWFDALVMDDGTLFSEVDNLVSYGLVPPPSDSPFPYPIGVTVDRQSDRKFSISSIKWYEDQQDGDDTAEPWVGLNCTACHTGSYVKDGKRVIIDGAPSMFDYQSFVGDMDKAMKATVEDDARWNSFVDKVLDGKRTTENETMLKTAFNHLLEWEETADSMNEDGDPYSDDGRVLEYGYGRVDAIGHIFNKVVMFNGGTAENGDGNPANAPVSYPFLWNMWKQDKVQWNGSVANSRIKIGAGSIEYGALGRNAGEVLGVFGDIVITPKPTGLRALLNPLSGYESSIRVRSLDAMEHVWKKLESPAWPKEFGELDPDLIAKGKTLFLQNCANNCHLTPDMQKPGEPTERMLKLIETPESELTDIWMACNAYIYDGPTGPMQGTKDLNGKVMGERAPVFDMLGTAVKGALLDKKGTIIKSAVGTIFGFERLPEVDDRAPGIFDPRSTERAVCLTTEGVDILAYKARPLDGIWATAPYLHNGSVKSLYELLLPADQRDKEFWVGNLEFDTEKVGYVDAKPANGQASVFKTHDEDDEIIEGNGNQGHEYGAANFSEDDRKALVEYMKSL